VGFLTSLSELCFGTRPVPTAKASAQTSRRRASIQGRRRCQVETLETRRLMAGDVVPQVMLGSVYFEEATGDDSLPDLIQVSFEGGATGTTLNRLVIDGDKFGDGLSTGDVFFDIADGGLGAFGDVGFSIVSNNGFTVNSVAVVDGGSQIIFTFTGFDAGEIFEFSLDADEAQFVQGQTVDSNALVEGGEFQRSKLTGTFSAPHYVDLTLNGTFWDAFDDDFAAATTATGLTLDLPNDRYTPDHDYTDRTAGAVVYAAQIPLATISGWVYHDRDDDGSFDTPSEQGIGGVTLELLKDGVGTGIFTTTSTAPGRVGYYEFVDLVAGNYGVRETQPTGWFDGKDTAGSHGGVAGNDIITGAVLALGDDGINYNFGELLPGSIAGRVILSQGPDCDFEDPQEFLEGIRIDLLDSNGNQLATTTTNAQGEYSFTGLPPGSYQIREHQPTQYYDGGEHIGSAGGAKHDVAGQFSFFTGIVLTSGLEAVEYDFCEHIGANLSGWVYHDQDNDGNFDRPGENGIGGVEVELFLDGVATGIKTTTSTTPGQVGYYQFTNLAPGSYTVRETQPTGWLDGKDTAGSHGGVASNDIIVGAVLNYGDEAVEYNFGELLPGSIRGRVHGDPGEDCNFEDPQNPLAGVRIDLLDSAGNVLQTTFTDSDGFYEFTGLAPGEYQIREHQPDGYFDSGERIGTAGGSKFDVPGQFSIFTGIMLTSGFDAVDYDFCEKPPASIRGRVHAHTGPNCDFDNPEFLLEGVKIDLLDMEGNVIATTFTDADGEYSFTDLPKGIYQIREHQPTEYYDGGERIGTAGGTKFDIGEQFSMFSNIVLIPGMDAIQYDFCEHIGVMLSGNVYHDRDDDGIFDRPTEEGIAGVVIKLFDENGNDTGLRATTDSAGFYKFNNLRAGKYSVMEVHPNAWLDGKDTPGNLGGTADPSPPGDMIRTIMIGWGEMGTEYNFGELKPGSIRGKVVVSTDPECDPDDGEPPIAGVRIDLLNDDGQVIATTTTDSQGRYEFTGLRPGTYTVQEHQPAGYFDLDAHVGDGGGVRLSTNLIGDIEISSDEHAAHYDFCEGPPATISGYVYIDGAPIFTDEALTPLQIYAQRNGVRTSDDTPLAGVVLMLIDGTNGEILTGDIALPGHYGSGPITTVTDANGFYQFTGIRAGTYGVVQIQPQDLALIDHVDHPGSIGGFAGNPDGIPVGRRIDQTGVPLPDQQRDDLIGQYGTDVIFAIALPAGGNSVENNFSEVRLQPEPPEIPPPPDPPIPLPQQQVFAPPGFPFLPRPFVPPQNFLPPPDYFGGSAKALGYTWHLSVMNAGQPRSIVQTGALFHYTATIDAAQWHDVPLDSGRWTLARYEGGNVSMLREETFGNADGVPVTGDFNGDGVWDVGIYVDGRWFLDLNANGRWDEGDLWAQLGTEADRPVTGDWDDDGKTDIGIYGPAWPRDPWAIRHEPGTPDADNYPSRPLAKMKNVPPTRDEATSGGRTLKRTAAGKPRTDLIDHVFHYGTPGDVPITGDWNGDGIRAIGVFRDGQWSLDLDGDGRFTEVDGSFAFGEAGDLPVIGDFNGDGVDEVGVFRDGKWIIDTNGNRQIDAHDVVFALGGAGDTPVVGDWDGDGHDDPGTYRATEPQDRLSRRAG
jgi:serine-aspartate repeat-containing protein C/D/E